MLEEILHNPKADARLKAEVALKILKAHGHLSEAPTSVEHSGPAGGDIPVAITHVIVVGDDDDPYAVVDGGMKELPSGG